MDLGLALWYRTPTMQRTRELFLFAPPSPTIMQSFTSQCRFALTSNLQTLCNNGTGFIKNTDCGVESAQVFVSEDYGVRDNKFSILLSTYSCYCWCSVASQRPSNWETATQSFRLYPPPAKNTGAEFCSRSYKWKKVVVHLKQWVQRDQLGLLSSTLH